MSRVLVPFVALLLATLACRAVDQVLEPQPTFAPPPTRGSSVETTAVPTGNSDSTATSSATTPTLSATPTAVETLEELGTPPEALEPLQQWLVQAYRTGSEVGNACSALRAAQWQQEGDTCESTDFNGDNMAEWLLTVDVTRLQEDSSVLPEGHPGDFWIINENGVIYAVGGIEQVDFFSTAPMLMELVDMTGDERPEAVTVYTTCGANTCSNNYHIIGAPDGEIRNLVLATVEEEDVMGELFANSISLSGVDAEAIRDETDDNLPDLVINGGLVGSVGGGIQRRRTEVWAWDGEAITLAEQQWEETGYRLHTLYNANYAFDQGQYDVAAQRYEAVVVDPNLEEVEWGTGTAEEIRSYVRQIAGFRQALLPLLRGDVTEATRWRNWLQTEYANVPLTQAAGMLISEWETNGNNLPAACSTVTTYLQGQTNPTGPLVDMGYNNPSITAENVCPIE